MKNLKVLCVSSFILFAGACSSTYHAGSPAPDDVYYSSKNHPTVQTTPPAQSSQPASSDYSTGNNNYSQDNNSNYQENSRNEDSGVNYQDPNSGNNSGSGYSSGANQSQDGQGNTYITNNYYNDDYYDYSYSARLRRYYTPAMGYGYYDPFYTNMYWYDYNPVSWGVSIYLGYNWWAPSWTYSSPFCYGGFSVGYSPWGYSPFYSPFYNNWYSPYSSYMMGYNHGYMDGYYSSMYAGYGYGVNNGYYNPYYYNSYDANSHHYGPRGEAAGNSPRRGSTRENSGMVVNPTLGQKYEQALAEGRVTSVPSGGSNNNYIPGKTRPATSVNEEAPRQIKGLSNQPNGGSDVINDNSHKGVISTKNEMSTQPVKGDIRQGNNNANPNSNPRNNVVPSPFDHTGSKNNGIPSDRSNETQTGTPSGTKIPGGGASDQSTQPRRQETKPFDQIPRNQNESNPRNYNNNTNDSRNNEWNPQPRNHEGGKQPAHEQPRNYNPGPAPSSPEPQRQNNDIRMNNPKSVEPSEPKKERSNFEMPRRNLENRAPVFQPRNEPKQYRDESNFSAPHERISSPSAPAPSRGNYGGERSNGGGGRRK